MIKEENTIQRCPHDKENPYTMILNDLIRDQSISPNCRWLLMYLLSNKDGWNINIKQIVNHLKGQMGRNCIYKIFNEAIEAGYIMREIPKKGNLNQGTKYFVSETPKFKKCFRHPHFQEAEIGDPQNGHLKKEHDLKNDQEKQQQAPLAPPAAVSSKGKGQEPKIWPSLKDIDIPEADKIWISKKYDESTVNNAVAFATHPETEVTTTLVQTIKWACRAKPELPIAKVDIEEGNKCFALRFDGLVKGNNCVEVLNKYVEFTTKGHSNSYILSYGEKDFKKIFMEAMERYGFDWT